MKATLALVFIATVLLGSIFLFGGGSKKKAITDPGLIKGTLELEEKNSLETKRKTENENINRKTLSEGKNKAGDIPVDSSYAASLTGLRGRILWESSKKPVVGVKVEAFELGTGFSTRSWNGEFPGFLSSFEPKVSVTTDKEGRFHLKGLERDEFFGLLIGAGTDKRAFRMVDRTAAPGETEELDDILLKDRGSLRGIVLGPNQKPLKGAKIYALDIPRIAFDFGLSGYDPDGLMVSQSSGRSFVTPLPPFIKKLEKKLPFGMTKTAEDGSFHIGGLRKGQTSILIISPNLVRTVKTTTIRPGKTRDLGRIILKEGEQIRGRVLDEQGKPSAQVLVSVTPKSPISTGFGRKPKLTDPNGTFQFKGLERGQHYVLVRWSEDFPWTLHGPYRPGDKIEIRSKTLFSKSVIVQGNHGALIPSAEFHLAQDFGEDFPPELFQPNLPTKNHLKKTEKPGVWTLYGLPAGRYTLRISAKGFAPFKARFIMGKKERSKKLICKLQKGVSITALILNRSGRPVSSARVYFRNYSTWGFILLGRTGKTGTLRIPIVPQAQGTMIGRHPRYALGATSIPLPVDGSTYKIILPNPGRIQGRIFDSTSTDKKSYTLFIEPGWTTRKVFRDLLLPRFTVTQLDGRFDIGGLQPGEYRIMPFINIGKITSIADAYTLGQQGRILFRKRTKVMVPEGGTVRTAIDLGKKNGKKGTGQISGFVRVDGKTSAGRTLMLWGNARRIAATKTDGSYTFSNLPAGRFNIVVQEKNGSFQEQAIANKSITLKNNEQKILNFDITLGVIEAQILDPKGNPLERVQLSLRASGKDPGWVSVFTDAEGKFRRRVHYGEWSIGLGWKERKATFSLPQTIIKVQSKRPVKVRIQAIESPSLHGSITLDFSKIHPDWREEARNSPPTQAYFQGKVHYWSIQLKKNGSRTPLEGQKHPYGKYRVFAYGGGGTWRGEVQITPENHAALNILLSPPKIFTIGKKQKKQKSGK